MRYRISTPVKGYDGVVAGVRFVDGIGESSTEAGLAYFRRHGYGITEVGDEPATQEEPAPPVVGPPSRGASKADWVKFATAPAQGMTEADAEAMTRDQLAEKYLGSKES